MSFCLTASSSRGLHGKTKMRVFFLICDAFDPVRLSPRLTPNLWRWANQDGAATGVGTSVMASCTYPNHASFVTGVEPDVHGIHVNHVVENGMVKGAWEVGPSVPTLFDRLQGVETEAVLGDHHLVGVMRADAADRHWPPEGDILQVGELDLLGYPADGAVLPRLLAALEGTADLVVGYFGSIDTISHIHGPQSEEATAAYQLVDAKVGELDAVLRSRWEDTVVVVVSDHVQDTAHGPGIDLRAETGEDLLVVDEGSAALVAGLSKPGRLQTVAGVSGWRLLGDGTVLAWCDPGRYFGPYPEPVFKGIHGGAHTRTQLALISGGHPRRQQLATAVKAGPVPAPYWAGAIHSLLA